MMATSLVDRLGGTPGLNQIIDDAYIKVMDEPELRPFFEGVDIGKIKRMQNVFLESALTDETKIGDTGISVRHAHHGLNIDRHHFSLFVECFLAALDESEVVSDDDINDVIARLNTYADDVMGITGVDG